MALITASTNRTDVDLHFDLFADHGEGLAIFNIS